VYEVVGAVDVLIVNSIEFWSGENPVKVSSEVRREDGGRVVQRAQVESGARAMTFEEYVGERLVSTTTVRYVEGADHACLAMVISEEGSVDVILPRR